MAVFLRTNIARKVGCRIGVPILVAIKAGDAAARPLRAAILRLVELLLRERRQEEAQSLVARIFAREAKGGQAVR